MPIYCQSAQRQVDQRVGCVCSRLTFTLGAPLSRPLGLIVDDIVLDPAAQATFAVPAHSTAVTLVLTGTVQVESPKGQQRVLGHDTSLTRFTFANGEQHWTNLDESRAARAVQVTIPNARSHVADRLGAASIDLDDAAIRICTITQVTGPVSCW